MKNRIRALFRRRFNSWLDKRSPRCSEITLNQRRIFIIPSSAGLGFAIMLLGLLLLAINYQNNLIFALCFWLFSIFLVAILHTYANLSGLLLRAGAAEPVFAGELASFHLHLEAGRRDRHRLNVGFPNQQMEVCDIDAEMGAANVIIKYPTQKRGALRPGRMEVTSRYPLGILRCWSAPSLDWHCLVYPQPRCLRPLLNSADSGEGHIPDRSNDSDEFSGFNRYQAGQSPRRIFWKAYAKGQGLLVKQYEQSQADELILDWDSLEGLSVEERLSTLCAWALDCDKQGLAYGLKLPKLTVASGSGSGQLSKVLRELAVF
ncbi:DUF58 domain-containing protein [Zhongshania aliphaticivorans]|mgnify:FL=1|jgi:uncharacterized protein (DUF58 family)|uniref:DUF58 domain-containing protein n=1 Tax=Zhongshania aliphaticivorans TaxID=1470434 RepID=UPI0039C8D14A|tara:strand:- start:2695 stop:3648 length:954 start_codon:yes stop_codon:yes gene_type:complete